MTTYETLADFPREIMDQVIARYGKPTLESRWLAGSPDGGDIPVAYASEQDARDDGAHRARKVFLKTWTLDDTSEIDSDVAVLTMAINMEDCPARRTYIRKAQERGYSI